MVQSLIVYQLFLYTLLGTIDLQILLITNLRFTNKVN